VTFHDHVGSARDRLIRAGVPGVDASLDAELLARHLLGCDRPTFISRRRDPAPLEFGPAYDALVARRERREPIAYITGAREFWGRDFAVDPRVLIPRPETELIVEQALATFRAPESPVLAVDVGTGSGCLAISLALEYPRTVVIATDTSSDALTVAAGNARRHGADSNVRLVRTRWLGGLRPGADLIVSNPPYVPSGTLGTLPPEVRENEPLGALLAGPEGLDGLRAVLREAAEVLRPGGWLLVEFGAGQEQRLRELVAAVPKLILAHVARDLQGLPRVAALMRHQEEDR
jgi:release factor glutamine methyltransferase